MLIYLVLWGLIIGIVYGTNYRFPPRRNSKYRVVTDRLGGFAAEYRNWFSPFWHECGTNNLYKHTNFYFDKNEAFDLIEKYKNGYRINGKFIKEVVNQE